MAIQGEVYKPKISPPSVKQLVDLEPKEITDILKLNLDQSTRIVQDKSIFEGYVAEVKDFSHIRNLYIKMKLIQPRGKTYHMCIYDNWKRCPLQRRLL